MKLNKLPLYLLLFAPVPVLAKQVTNLWQIPWWSGLRFAFLSEIIALVLAVEFSDIFDHFNTSHARLTAILTRITRIMLISLLVVIALSGLIRDTKPHRSLQGLAAGPDVYFIVLDSYTASETLLELYSYDNSWFLEQLRDLGFQAGSCTSPAAFTGPSLGAILNGRESAPKQTWLNWRLVQRSLLRTTLEKRGYDTIAFATGFDWNEPRDAAYFIEPDLGTSFTDFELYLLGNPSMHDLKGDHFRARTETILDNLALAATLPGSQFTYAHIVQPHPPFVFTSTGAQLDDNLLLNQEYNGNEKNSVAYTLDSYTSGYIGQLEYISRAILPQLRAILESDPDPLIILIGDHGPWYSPEYNLSTLCAVYGDLPLDPTQAVNKITHPAD